MPRQRKHIQISAEAFETLASLKTNTGISVFQLIDCLTGLDDTLKERLDLLFKNEFILSENCFLISKKL